MEKNISSHVRSCLDLFRTTIDASEDSPKSSLSDSFLRTIKDEQSRFKVWSGNIGAHRTGMSSLDYRLRDSSHIRNQVIRLLDDISGLLEDASAIISGEEVPWDQVSGNDDVASGGESGEEDEPETELDQISGDITDVVNCLLRLSVTIRNPAPHDRFIESSATDTSHFEPFDIEHVHSRFSSIDSSLAERLGKAISRRRQYFKYRKAHHAKLCHGLDEHHLEVNDDLPQTIASSLPERLKDKLALGYPGQDGLLTDDRSDTRVSLTSYATSVTDDGERCVPSLPEEAYKGPFQCPFCYMIIEANDEPSWKRHVFGDLRPYICLVDDCENPDNEFSQRHLWIDHMKQRHWKEYKCPFGCALVFPSLSLCEDHVDQSHPEAGASQNPNVLEMLSAQPLDTTEGLSCPICSDKLTSIRQYQHHVGRHQEQLALFALPSLDLGEDIDPDDDLNSRIGSHTSVYTVHSICSLVLTRRREYSEEGASEGHVGQGSHDPASTESGPSGSTSLHHAMSKSPTGHLSRPSRPPDTAERLGWLGRVLTLRTSRTRSGKYRRKSKATYQNG